MTFSRLPNPCKSATFKIERQIGSSLDSLKDFSNFKNTPKNFFLATECAEVPANKDAKPARTDTRPAVCG